MKVLLTGATGFIGSHSINRILEAGHTLRLMVRSPEKVGRVLVQHGLSLEDFGTRIEVVAGDMTDAGIVRAALGGCDTVIHAAASVAIGRAKDVFADNTLGVTHVLGIASELGLDPIVYTSSVSAMFPPVGPVQTVDDPVASLTNAYSRSKAEGERCARDLQARGAPVVIVYPAGVYGPVDPSIGEGAKGLRDRIKYGWPITRGGTSCVDVRDIAQILVACLEPGRGPRRYMAGGHFVTWREEADLCESLIGRKVRRIPLPVPIIRLTGHVVDAIKRVRPSFDYPLTHEASLFVTESVPCDSRRTVEELAIAFRPTAETLGDAIRWLVDAGELEASDAPSVTS